MVYKLLLAPELTKKFADRLSLLGSINSNTLARKVFPTQERLGITLEKLFVTTQRDYEAMNAPESLANIPKLL